jgi:hypothetical protein
MLKPKVPFATIGFIITLIAVMVIAFLIPEQVRALISTNQISDGAITTPKIADSSVTTPKLTDHSVTAAKLAGVSKIIFATCDINFGPITPHADGLADCSVPGTATGDNVVASPNNGLFDTMSFYAGITLDGKVRFLVRNNADVSLPATPTSWSVIVFHK